MGKRKIKRTLLARVRAIVIHDGEPADWCDDEFRYKGNKEGHWDSVPERIRGMGDEP